MRALLSSVLVLTSVALLVACPDKKEDEEQQQNLPPGNKDGGADEGDASEPPPHDPATPEEFDLFTKQAATTYCETLKRCGMVDETLMEHCKASLTREMQGGDQRAAISKGYSSFYMDQGAKCLLDLATLPCTEDAFEQLDDTCGEMMVGNQTKGEPCIGYGDCQGSLMCSGTGCAKTCVDHYGTLQPGESCGQDVSGFCDETTGYCDYQTQKCVAWLTEGADCTAGACDSATFCHNDTLKCTPRLDAGAACSVYAWQQCKTGLFCKENSSGSEAGVCAALLGEGGACTSSNQCGTASLDGRNYQLTCNIQGKCSRMERKLGESCDQEQYCMEGFCKGATANAPGTCSQRTYVGADQSCSLTEPAEIVCNMGLRCDRQTATCKPLSGPGGACAPAQDDCQMFLQCNGTTCVAPAAQGQSCAESMCLMPAVCDELTDMCSAAKPDGADCMDSDEYLNLKCEDHVCAPSCG